MQITQPRGNYIEKIVRDGQGRLVRLSFCVYENGGHVRARLLNAVYLKESKQIENKVFTLSGAIATKNFGTEIQTDKKFVSPYFSSNLLNFLGSKPRAPTC